MLEKGNITARQFTILTFLFTVGTTVLAYVGYFMTTEILIRTPIQFINLLFAIIILGMALLRDKWNKKERNLS